MDLHDYYLRLPTLDISLLRAVDDKHEDESALSHHLIQSYSNVINQDNLDINKLETYRMLLCYEYHKVFKENESCYDKKYIVSDVESICSSSIKAVVQAEFRKNIAKVTILRDIIILQTVLYYNTVPIKQHVHNFLKAYCILSHPELNGSGNRIIYMRILEYFLKSLCLHRLFPNSGSNNKTELEEIGPVYLEVVKSWMQEKRDCEWESFASMFPLLVDTFAPKDVLYPLWDYILDEDIPSDLFTALSIMVNKCFTLPCSTKLTHIHHVIFAHDTLWRALAEGLRSPLQRWRKQALYIMRETTNFMSSANLHLQFKKAELTPFICSRSNDSASYVDNIRQKFFLVWEGLEQKQCHLVVSVLPYISNLVEAFKEHKPCECFDAIWLGCILERALQHENHNVVKWSVSYVCKLDPDLFDMSIFKLFVCILNNSFLYECQSNEYYPEIVKDLRTFFRCMAHRKTNELNRILKKISKITWGPVAIFYVMHALRTIPQKAIRCNNWRTEQLLFIRSLVENNLSKHSNVLRTASQIELLRTMPNFIRYKVDDLTLLANVLAAFPSKDGVLLRISSLRDIITTWLQKVLAKEDAVVFVEQTCVKYSCGDLTPDVSLRTFAFMIFLLIEARLIPSCKTCPTENALNNWLSSLSGIETRPYADIRPSIDIAEFLSHSLRFFNHRKIGCSVMNLILLHVRPALMFLSYNMKKMAAGLTYEHYTRYTAMVSSYIDYADLAMPRGDFIRCVEILQDQSICLLKSTRPCQSIEYLYGLCIFHLTLRIVPMHDACFVYINNWTFKEELLLQAVNDDDTPNSRGNLISEFYLLLSRLMLKYLDFYSTTCHFSLLDRLKSFELGRTEIVCEVAKILKKIINSLDLTTDILDISERETFESIFQSCWRCTFASKKNSVFWKAIHLLTAVIVNDQFLQLPNIMEFVEKFVDQLLQEGDNAPRFKRILLSCMSDLEIPNLMKLKNPLLNCLLHGSVLRRDERVENRACLFVTKHLGQGAFSAHFFETDDEFTEICYTNDTAVRALATVLLYKIISRPESKDVETVLLYSLICETLEKYGNKRYFNDSYTHKIKLRLTQILLILQPTMNKRLLTELQLKLRDMILSESNQHSVRLMQEWLLIRIWESNHDLHDELWIFFEECIAARPGCTVSAASIVYHVAQLLEEDFAKNIFILSALPYVARSCLGQQYNMRLYNQFVLTRLYQLMKERNDVDSISEYNRIYQASVISLQQASLAKKIEDDFYFSGFHPLNDYSLKTIYYELPRLTNVSCDEWISPDDFRAFKFQAEPNHPLKCYNRTSFLSGTTASMYLAKSPADNVNSLVDTVESYLHDGDSHNIQRKFDPSKSTVPFQSDNFRNRMEHTCNRRAQIPQDLEKAEKGLIMVASLVNRSPNLGGIARTCEIFGANLLVVANLDSAKDREFRCVSVTAEEWLNMLQIKPCDLQQYLLEKKNAGWSVIGVEQTANSVNLLEMQFEKKTVLVLGNENDGIPANLLPLFNKCVEIPQTGVIRSLNVHVSAAICIFQYASQHTFN